MRDFRLRSAPAGCLAALALILIAALLPRGLRAEEGDWGSPDNLKQDLELTLNNGATVRGHLSAETKDSVMLSVVSEEGKITQTFAKTDVKSHTWVASLDIEITTKIAAWPADQEEALLTYAQEMYSKGAKTAVLSALASRQKDLTAADFKLYVQFLLKNKLSMDARSALTQAGDQHPDWRDEIADLTAQVPAVEKPTQETMTKDTSEIPDIGTSPGSGIWGSSYQKALKLAARTKRPVLILFTSDADNWPLAKKLDDEMLKSKEFHEWAVKNVVLLRVEFPKAKLAQEPDLKAVNARLQVKYQASTFPVMFLLDENGKAYQGRLGYDSGGAEHWIKSADAIIALYQHRH